MPPIVCPPSDKIGEQQASVTADGTFINDISCSDIGCAFVKLSTCSVVAYAHRTLMKTVDYMVCSVVRNT